MAITCTCKTGICVIHPKIEAKPILVDPRVAETIQSPSLDISTEDKLQLKTLQVTALDLQLAAREAADRMNNAQMQLNTFAGTLFEKHAVSNKEYVLDLAGPKFVKRETM